MAATRRIVVIRPGALGDTLLTLPSLALLRRRWPAARLTFVGRRDALPLVAASGLADTTSPFDLPDWSALFADEPPAAGLAFETLRRCDIAVAWLPDAGGAVARTLSALGARRAVVAPGRPGPDAGEHAALVLARTLAPLGVHMPEDHDELWRLVPSLAAPCDEPSVGGAPAHAPGAEAGPPLVAIHPGSGGAAKRWPAERFAAIVERLAATGYRPLLVQGPQDEPVVRRVLGAPGSAIAPPAIAAGQPLEDLAATLARCAAFLGNDSGVSHLAGLLGVPTLALFGPTNPAVWSPLGPRVRTLRAPSRIMDSLAVETVWAALHELLPNAPGL